MLIDRENAKSTFNYMIQLQDKFICVKGQKGMGKSYFVKEVTKDKNTLLCKRTLHINYWKNIFLEIKPFYKDIIIFLDKNNISILPENKYANELKDDEAEYYLEQSIQNEILSNSTLIGKHLGKYFADKYTFIILDDISECDNQSYEWMISLLDKYSSCGGYVIFVYDTDDEFRNRQILKMNYPNIEISKYDNSKAYYDLLNTAVYFDNHELLFKIAEKLFKIFDKSSYKILSIISLLKEKELIDLSDNEKKEIILDCAASLSFEIIDKLDSVSKEILLYLAVSPVNLTKKDLKILTGFSDKVVEKGIIECKNHYLIQDKYFNNGQKAYDITNTIPKDIYIKKANNICNIYETLYAHLNNNSGLKPSDKLMLAISADDNDTETIAKTVFCHLEINQDDIESKVQLLDRYIKFCERVPLFLFDMHYVNLLYKFGYYNSSYKLILGIKNSKNRYDYLMKKGDIEHLILNKHTATTFKEAAELNGITTTQKLSAINRQVMALTQENEKELNIAKDLYIETIEKYKKCECDGLIELYRNSNNIFEYETALEYTIQGYNLAMKLNNSLEAIKNLHNICMLKLLNGNYYKPLNHKNLSIEPNFELIISKFEEHHEFRHELAYPLLDLGTLKMFDFILDLSRTDILLEAKSYFSKAQLYAKSFYAKNIADTSLLLVNSYLYINNKKIVQSNRKRMFENYKQNKENIKDFRVHRKILFSLATSASITGDIEDGQKYLLLSKPHVFGSEIIRYNNLCKDLNIPNEKLNADKVNLTNIRPYHSTSKFVPWLISFGH